MIKLCMFSGSFWHCPALYQRSPSREWPGRCGREEDEPGSAIVGAPHFTWQVKCFIKFIFFLLVELFPGRSYLTEHGVRALLQYLPKLQTLNFPGGWLLLTKQFSEEFVNKILLGGNLGKVFDMDWEPYFGPHLALENFSHLMTVTSGGVEVLS